MLDLANLLNQLRLQIYSSTENNLDLIIKQNSRIENYFSVIIIMILEELKSKNKIIDYKFQHLLTNEIRKHIDFFIIGKNFKVYLEIKHIAIDTKEKKGNNRSINFYTSNSKQGRKVGIIGDLEKLNNTEKREITDFISFSIVTNTPENKTINERIKFIQKQTESNKWKIEEYSSKSEKLSFIICSKPINRTAK
jgi:hypothetical protein